MEMPFTADQRAFVHDAIFEGRLRDESEALREAMALWEARERTRAELMLHVTKAKKSLAEGRGRLITDLSMRALADDVHRLGMARLEAEQHCSSLRSF